MSELSKEEILVLLSSLHKTFTITPEQEELKEKLKKQLAELEE